MEAEAEAEMGAGACDTAAKEEQEQDDWEFIPSNILSQPGALLPLVSLPLYN